MINISILINSLLLSVSSLFHHVQPSDVVISAEKPHGCQYRGTVISDQGSFITGQTANDSHAPAIIKDFKDQAVKIGANYIQLIPTSLASNDHLKDQAMVTNNGKAYYCPKDDTESS